MKEKEEKYEAPNLYKGVIVDESQIIGYY